MRMDLPIQQILQQPTSHHLINPCTHSINAPKTRSQPTQPGKSIKYAAFLALAQSQSQVLAKRIHSKLDGRVLFWSFVKSRFWW